MRALLDESLPRTWKPSFKVVDVAHVADLGWHGVKNGELLRRATDEGYAALITADRNLEFQQHLPSMGIGVVVVRALTNRLQQLEPLTGAVIDAVQRIRPGETLRIGPEL